MRKILLALATIVVTASLQAVTIKWNVADTTMNTGWANNLYADNNETGGKDVGFYLVYAESTSGAPTWDAATVWETAKAAAGGTGTSNGVTVWGGSIDSEGKSVYTENGDIVDSDVDRGVEITTRTTSSTVKFMATLEDVSPGGYFYLVLFNTKEDNGQYVVTNAMQYLDPTTDEYIAANAANGIYGTEVDGAAPSIGNYIDTSWLGGQWQAVPEPTALALLAFGVAGLALRRKV